MPDTTRSTKAEQEVGAAGVLLALIAPRRFHLLSALSDDGD